MYLSERKLFGINSAITDTHFTFFEIEEKECYVRVCRAIENANGYRSKHHPTRKTKEVFNGNSVFRKGLAYYFNAVFY